MRLRYPGLVLERLPSEATRYRVRVEGDVGRKITLPFGPEHPDFHQAYRAARAGVRLMEAGAPAPSQGTMEWLAKAYLAALSRQVRNGAASPLTLKQRENQLRRFLQEKSETGKSVGRVYAGLPMMIPQRELVALRDRHANTPGETHNLFKTLRAMFEWALESEHVTSNPAKGIKTDYKNQGGAVPWSLEDLAQFRAVYPQGTMAHLALSLFTFTACRIGDAVNLGRAHEKRHDGALWLHWQPQKKGSNEVIIPILPPLLAAMKAQKVVGETYLLTEKGQPFASSAALARRFRKWCDKAGLEGRSPHGIRKAAGHLLALAGATQYEIMAVHGHANASTSEVYTRAVERMRLGGMAGSRLSGMDW